MTKRSKALTKADTKVSEKDFYTVEEAVRLMKELSSVKFDATAEIHFNLGINPKHADQQIRTTLSLPNGTGKTVKLIVFCSDDKVAAAKAAGAIEAGSDDLVDKISKGWTDFDVAIATPDMMRGIAKVARVLGPKGLMPNPKTGTVTPDIEKAIKAVLGGRIEIRNDKAGIIHTIFGKLSFDNKKLIENVEAVIQAIKDARPSGQKGEYIKSVNINSTMGVGIKLNLEA
jgi:large subunit ribosomal protein L1